MQRQEKSDFHGNAGGVHVVDIGIKLLEINRKAKDEIVIVIEDFWNLLLKKNWIFQSFQGY